MRTIIFGDIHGCLREWEDLLHEVKAGPSDRLIAVGDLIAKGPSTRGVLELAMRLPNLQCVLGNHEWYLLRRWQSGRIASTSDPDHRAVIAQLDKDLGRYMAFIGRWPFYLDLPECLIVHAGLRPGIPLGRQTPEDLVSIRALQDGRPWYAEYGGPKLVVHGHWAAQGLMVRDHVIGLDSGCVYGKRLSAVILPERRIVSVPAHTAYKPIG